MKRFIPLLVLLLWTAPSNIAAQTATASRTKEFIGTLASERFGGRQAGTEGERLAADYISAQLRQAGVVPLPGRSDLFLPFEFTAGSHDGGSSLSLTRTGAPATFTGAETVQALSLSDDATVSGEAVFAGYGLVVPETQGVSYDSYAALDVNGKIVVVLRYSPEDAEPELRTALARYSDLRYKAMAARQRGAKAIVVVTGPRSPNAGLTVQMTFDTALAGSGIPAVSVGGAAATTLFQGAEKTLAAVQQELDSGNPH